MHNPFFYTSSVNKAVEPTIMTFDLVIYFIFAVAINPSIIGISQSIIIN